MAGPTKLLNGASNWTLRLFGLKPPGEEERVHSPEELRTLVEQSQEFGTLNAQDARMLEGVFEFSEKTAEEVMTPRTDVVSIAGDATVETAADVVAEARRSRYPVYQDTLDEITGIVHAKDILRAVPGREGEHPEPPASLRPRNPGSRGRADRHEAAQDPHGGGPG